MQDRGEHVARRWTLERHAPREHFVEHHPEAPEVGAGIDLQPTRLALMHGSVYTGDTQAALHALADDYDVRVQKALAG